MMKPIDQFMETKAEIDAMLARLIRGVSDHFGYDPTAINWGHVGSATEIKTHLAAAIAAIEGNMK